MPAVAERELPRQGVQHRKLCLAEALHDLTGVAGTAGAGVVRDVPAGVDRRIGPARVVDGTGAAELNEYVGELMAWVERHRPVGRVADRERPAVVEVGLCAGQPVDCRWLAGCRVLSGDAGDAEHVIEGPVLEHEYENVLDKLLQRCPSRRAGIHTGVDRQRVAGAVEMAYPRPGGMVVRTPDRAVAVPSVLTYLAADHGEEVGGTRRSPGETGIGQVNAVRRPVARDGTRAVITAAIPLGRFKFQEVQRGAERVDYLEIDPVISHH